MDRRQYHFGLYRDLSMGKIVRKERWRYIHQPYSCYFRSILSDVREPLRGLEQCRNGKKRFRWLVNQLTVYDCTCSCLFNKDHGSRYRVLYDDEPAFIFMTIETIRKPSSWHLLHIIKCRRMQYQYSSTGKEKVLVLTVKSHLSQISKRPCWS